MTSFGKQLPPYPKPGNKNLFPILESVDIPTLTISASAPNFSHKLAISFINDIFVAKNELEAYFVISADLTSITITLFPVLKNGEYISCIIAVALSELEPITTLSGFKKSSTAFPCFKNSGFDTTSKGWFVFVFIISATLSAVPTGTVDLSTITLYPFIDFAIDSATLKTYCKSALPSSP